MEEVEVEESAEVSGEADPLQDQEREQVMAQVLELTTKFIDIEDIIGRKISMLSHELCSALMLKIFRQIENNVLIFSTTGVKFGLF